MTFQFTVNQLDIGTHKKVKWDDTDSYDTVAIPSLSLSEAALILACDRPQWLGRPRVRQ